MSFAPVLTFGRPTPVRGETVHPLDTCSIPEGRRIRAGSILRPNRFRPRPSGTAEWHTLIYVRLTSSGCSRMKRSTLVA